MDFGYSVINTAKSVISSVVSGINIIDIGNYALIRNIQKGVHNCKPTLPRQSATWELSLVLRYFKFLYPLKNVFLKQLPYKLNVSLALTTRQRVQTLIHLI